MITAPTAFSQYQTRSDALSHAIVKYYDGSTTWYFGTIEIPSFSEGFVYGILNADSISIMQDIDLLKKTSSRAIAQFALANFRYRTNATGESIRFSDEIGDMEGDAIDIYFFNTPTVTALADCLHVFSGEVDKAPTFDMETIKISCIDGSEALDTNLPRNIMSGVYSSAPIESANDYIPLLYGTYTKTFDSTSDTGLAVALQTEKERLAKYVVADHVVNSIVTAFGSAQGLPEAFSFDNATKTASDSGRSSVTIVRNAGDPDIDATVYVYPTGNFVGDYDLGGPVYTDDLEDFVSNFGNMSDQNETTHATVRDFLDPSVGGAMNAFVYMIFGNYASGDQKENSIGEITGDGSSELTFQIKATSFAGITWGGYVPRILIVYNDGSEVVFTLGNIALSATVFSNITTDVWSPTYTLQSTGSGLDDCSYVAGSWDYTGDPTERTTFEVEIDATGTPDTFKWRQDGGAYTTGVSITGASQVLADGAAVLFAATTGHTLGNAWTVKPDWEQGIVWHLFTGHREKESGAFPIIFLLEGQTSSGLGDGTPNNQDLLKIYEARLKIEFHIKLWEQVWVAATGRQYDSWITGRSSNYADTDLIEDPAGIIESILRDELSFANGDIDLTTFIDAENTSVEARINLHSENIDTARKVIMQLVKQSTFTFVYTAEGKARLIPLNDGSPTTDRTITMDFIAPNGIKLSQSEYIRPISEVTVNSRYLQEYERYQDVDEATTEKEIFNWPNVAGSSVSHLKSNIIHGVGRSILNVQTLGCRDADIDVGDWIELDEITIDPHLLYTGGATWNDKQFLVFGYKKTLAGTTVKGMRINAAV